MLIRFRLPVYDSFFLYPYKFSLHPHMEEIHFYPFWTKQFRRHFLKLKIIFELCKLEVRNKFLIT